MFFLLVLAVQFSCGRPSGEADPDILLITLDTTRWDHLSCYDGSKANTPYIDAIARSGILFTRALTTVPVTLPAHASILTGLYPLEHGIRNNGGYRLDEGVPTIASVLHEKGYRTGAVIGAFVLDSQFGLDTGFDVYDDFMPGGGGKPRFSYIERNGDAVTDAAISFLEEAGSSPFFLWAHYFDPHFPYQPPPAFKKKSPYGGEVGYVDACIGRLMARLEEVRGGRPLLTVIVGDHGEDLGDRGEMTHGVFLYDTTVRIPLIFSFPGRIQSGGRSEELASVIDIFPTILELAGVDTKAFDLHGRNLIADIESDRTVSRPVLIETLLPYENKGWSPLEGVILGEWKYIRAPREELYNMRDDPAESRSLAESESELVGRMNAILDSLKLGLSSKRGLSTGGLSSRAEADHETIEKLASLGYVTDMVPELGDLADPKDMLHVLARHQVGLQYYETGRFAEAETAFREALKYDPTNVTLINYAGLSNYNLDRPAEALHLWEKALEINPGYINVLLNKGMVLLEMGAADPALKAYDEVLKLNPKFVRALVGRGKALRTKGELEQARVSFEEAISINPASSEARLWMGIFLKDAGDYEGALRELDIARALDQGMIEAMREKGLIFIALDRTGDAVEIFEDIAALEPGSVKCLVDLGIALEKGGEEKRALEIYTRAVGLDPDYHAAHNNLGSVLDRMGRTREAEAAYREALSIRPDFPEAYYNLGFLLAGQGRTSEAMEAFSRFLELWDADDAARDRAAAMLQELRGG